MWQVPRPPVQPIGERHQGYISPPAVKGGKNKLGSILTGICAVLLFGGGLAVCLIAGSDYFNMGIPMGIIGLILCIMNAAAAVGSREVKK